jgi:hypothetical protein
MISSDTSPNRSKEPTSSPRPTRTTNTKSSCPTSSRASLLISPGMSSFLPPAAVHYSLRNRSTIRANNPCKGTHQTPRRSRRSSGNSSLAPAPPRDPPLRCRAS